MNTDYQDIESDQKTNICENQRPPEEAAPPPSRGHPHTFSSAGGR